jgi:hypothetical protein
MAQLEDVGMHNKIQIKGQWKHQDIHVLPPGIPHPWKKSSMSCLCKFPNSQFPFWVLGFEFSVFRFTSWSGNAGIYIWFQLETKVPFGFQDGGITGYRSIVDRLSQMQYMGIPRGLPEEWVSAVVHLDIAYCKGSLRSASPVYSTFRPIFDYPRVLQNFHQSNPPLGVISE